MEKPILKFNDGRFRILTLGDLHDPLVLETRLDASRDRDMYHLVEMSIKAFRPDLIVYLGDTLCERDESPDFSLYREGLTRVLKPTIESGIPFAAVLGNHEHDMHQEKQVAEVYEGYETSLVQNDPSAPRGDLNYHLLVKDSKGEKDIFNLWFIDSNNLSDDQALSKYDWVHADQIAWYEQKAAEIAAAHGGEVLPAILFQHNPIAEEYRLMREASTAERPFAAKGHYKWGDKYYVLKDGVDGYLGEGPCAPCFNEGQFESWKKVGDITGAFFGHDHLNDFTGKVDGIMLGQNKTSGFFCYTDGCRSAVRLTTVFEEDPRNIVSKVYHFKELGLECHSLGPIERHITDRQSINLHKVSYAAAGLAGTAGLIKLIKKLK